MTREQIRGLDKRSISSVDGLECSEQADSARPSATAVVLGVRPVWAVGM